MLCVRVVTQLFTDYFGSTGVINFLLYVLDKFKYDVFFITQCHASVLYAVVVCLSVWCRCIVPAADWTRLQWELHS